MSASVDVEETIVMDVGGDVVDSCVVDEDAYEAWDGHVHLSIRDACSILNSL